MCELPHTQPHRFFCIKSGMLSRYHPSLDVGELSGARHLDWSEGAQKQGLGAARHLYSKARAVLMLMGLGQPCSLPPV